MPPHSDFWTEIALRRLRDGIARDEPRRQIAAALDTTKNAVIGKATKRGSVCATSAKLPEHDERNTPAAAPPAAPSLPDFLQRQRERDQYG